MSSPPNPHPISPENGPTAELRLRAVQFSRKLGMLIADEVQKKFE